MTFLQIKALFKLAITAAYERSLETDELSLLSEAFYSCDESQKEHLRTMTYRLCEEIECR